MEVVQRTGGDSPFGRRDVEEWSRLDELTGMLEHARVQTDQWAGIDAQGGSHKYGKVSKKWQIIHRQRHSRKPGNQSHTLWIGISHHFHTKFEFHPIVFFVLCFRRKWWMPARPVTRASTCRGSSSRCSSQRLREGPCTWLNHRPRLHGATTATETPPAPPPL